MAVVISSSSRAAQYYTKTRPAIERFAALHRLKFLQIELNAKQLSDDELLTRKLSDRTTIAQQLTDGDLAVACGGDGVAQLTFDAVYCANQSLVTGASFAVIPLGNGNDLGRALNGHKVTVRQILQQATQPFYPLEISFQSVDTVLLFAVASYITFGATTKLVDLLNQCDVRLRRRRLAKLSPAAALPLKQVGVLSRAISLAKFPDFWCQDKLYRHDSVGFFTVSAAHGLLRVARRYLFARDNFFFHLSTMADKNLVRKILTAGHWAAKFPGHFTVGETIEFRRPVDLVANLAGDNIRLIEVDKIKAVRAVRAVRVLTSR